MFGIRKKSETSEDMVCSLCEFSCERDGKLLCKGKEISGEECCGKFIFDPRKKKVKRLSVKERSKEIEFPSLD